MTVRIGFAGCGKIAATKHIPELLAMGDVKIVALFDAFKSAAEKTGREFQLNARVHETYEALLADPEVDCIYVLTPNITHAEYSIRAMRAGKHVMCEKPMATCAADAERVAQVAKETGMKYAVSFQNRFRSDVLALKKAIDDGALGEIYFARAVAVRRRGVPVWGSFLDRARQGGGPLLDIGSHSIDMALWLMGNYEVNYVSGVSFNKLGKRRDEPNRWGSWEPERFEVEDSAFGFAVMKNGAAIVIESSWALNRIAESEACVELSGTGGGADLYRGLTLNGTENGRLFTKSFKDYQEKHASGYSGAKNEAESWIGSLRGEGEHCVRPEQTCMVSRIVEAIYRSSETGKPIYF